MDAHKYTCHYCHELYVPKRRHAQKYCSNSCRSKAYHIRQRNISNENRRFKSEVITVPMPEKENSKQDQKMSLAGVGNAALGAMAYDATKSLITHEDKKPATKGDLKYIASMLQRYQKIEGEFPRSDGALPYFDLDTKRIVYFKPFGTTFL